MGEPTHQLPPVEQPLERQLDSWKEIAVYLNRDVTTVQRWEKREGMPVHRHVHNKRGSVYALAEELDDWLTSRRSPAEEPERRLRRKGYRQPPVIPCMRPEVSEHVVYRGHCSLHRAWRPPLGCVFRHRAIVTAAPRVSSLAVLPFRNLSGDPAQQYLADGITEALIGRLANIHDLHVSPYTSVVRFKNQQLSDTRDRQNTRSRCCRGRRRHESRRSHSRDCAVNQRHD